LEQDSRIRLIQFDPILLSGVAMRSVSRDTLKRILEEFPTVAWGEAELNELVAPSYGVITGFQHLLTEVKELADFDLGDTPMAGALHRPSGR
jgi:hypothetical protein